jgi:asparagine synthase (glutamine-hydrolysing)
MGAIAGVINWRSDSGGTGISQLETNLARITNQMATIGAGDRKTWSDGPATVSFQPTAADSIEAGSLDHDSEARLTITGDVRLDNRASLCDQLAVPADRRESISDSALILLAWRKWEFECPDHLLGDFAFAIWDGSNRRLFAARDLAGVRPFYYHHDGQQFVFASDLPAVSAAEGVPWELRENFTAAKSGEADPGQTAFATIRRLPQHHALVVTEEGIRTFAWWSPDRVPQVRHSSDADYVEALRDLLHQAVACRLPESGNVAAHLSGGISSSSVATIASQLARHGGQNLSFLHALPRDASPLVPKDERRLVKAIIDQEGRPCHDAPEMTPFTAAWTRIRHIGDRQPGIQLREPLTRRTATQHGAHILLTGLGGKGLATYPGSHDQHLYEGSPLRWLSFFREYAKLHNRPIVGAIVSKSHLGRIPRKLRKFCRGQFRNPSKGRLKQEGAIWRKDSLYRPDTAGSQKSLWNQFITRPTNSVREVHIRRLCGADLVSALEGWTINGWSEQVEYRHPMLDRRLIEFVMGIPGSLLCHHGHMCWLVREAMKDVLPNAWGPFAKPALQQDRNRLNAEFDRDVARPLFTELLAEDWDWQCIDPAAVKAVMDSSRDHGSWWGEPVSALKVEMFLNRELERSVLNRLTEWEAREPVEYPVLRRASA